MKNILQNWKIVLSILGLSFCLTSCIKDDVADLKDEGANVIKILDGGGDAVVKAMNLDPLVEKISILDLRRDLNSSTSLQQSTTVTITNTQEFLDAYNDENGTSYELLPTDAYTLSSGNDVTVSGDTWTVNMNAGEFAKSVDITLDKSKMDLSKQYAFGFQITKVSAGSVSGAANTQIVNPLIKNKYDGVYDLTITTTGWSAYNISDDEPGAYGEIALATAGASVVNFENHEFNTDLQPGIDASGTNTQFGAASPVFTFDPATNKLIDVYNSYPDDGRGRAFVINPAAPDTDNVYDPVTGNMILNYLFKQNLRPDMTVRMELTYVGPR